MEANNQKKKRKRIPKFNNQDRVKTSSKLRQLWAECGYCAKTVRLHLEHKEFKGEHINI